MTTMCRLWILSFALLVVAWLLNNSIPPRRPPLVNYDCSEFFDPQKLELPRTEEEIVEVVQNALYNGHQVRVLGSGHSRNSLAYSKDVIISLEHYKGIVSLDRQAQQVTVKGGTTLEELAEYLDNNGFAISVLPAILEQTVAGAICTATHGSRAEYGNLATLVTKLKLVTGEGKIASLSANDRNTDFFKAAQVSLGLLGVITEVTLQCEPSFKLEEITKKRSLEYCLEDLNTLLHSAEHVKLWVELYSETCDVFTYTRTDKEIQTIDKYWKIKIDWKMQLWEPFLILASWLPSLAPTILGNSFLYSKIFYPEHVQVGNSFQVLAGAPIFVPGNMQSEFAVDAENCVAAVRALKRETDKLRTATIFIEIRFVSADDIWMSMNHNRKSCQLTVILYDSSELGKRQYFDSIYQAFVDLDFKPRQHFGKYVNMSLEELTEFYPKYSNFKKVRSQFDPKGIFLNKWTENMFH